MGGGDELNVRAKHHMIAYRNLGAVQHHAVEVAVEVVADRTVVSVVEKERGLDEARFAVCELTKDVVVEKLRACLVHLANLLDGHVLRKRLLLQKHSIPVQLSANSITVLHQLRVRTQVELSGYHLLVLHAFSWRLHPLCRSSCVVHAADRPFVVVAPP